MTGARDTTRLYFSSNFAGIVANKIEQSFYSVYSCSGIESIKHALSFQQILGVEHLTSGEGGGVVRRFWKKTIPVAP